MNTLDQKIASEFEGLVVRKDLVKSVKGNAIVPSYVLEYLLGQYCATSDEPSILSGIDMVKEILQKHYVHRNEAGLIRSNIREKGRYKIIDRVSVELNDKTDSYEASFSNLGIKKVLVSRDTIKKHQKLLVGGVWCIVDLEYEFDEEAKSTPWILSTIKPIQMSAFDFDFYLDARKKFSLEEWIDVLMQSIGFDPSHFSRREKFLQLLRLVPFCERNYNMIELGPKGTGKSHIYSEFSPHGILISGGEVSVPKLFVNNSSGKIGLVGYWDCVAFDEFAGRQKKANKALVDIMKNYMANKSFSRGIETLGAEASMAFVGNTKHTLEYMLKHTDLFDELPVQFYDSAFIDRIHYYLPGWEVDVIRGEMFTDGFGFVVDYLAEVLRTLRNHDYSHLFDEAYFLSEDISTRDRNAIKKTFSGLMKILFPHQEASEAEIGEILEFSVEGRKRVKDQLMRLDKTYPDTDFYIEAKNGGERLYIKTLEEKKHPEIYYKRASEQPPNAEEDVTPNAGQEPEIMKLVRADEAIDLEHKSSMRWCTTEGKVDKKLESVIIKTICALTNTKGGVLLIGVDDEHNILGLQPDYDTSPSIKDGDGFERHLRGLIQKSYDQIFSVEKINIVIHALGDKEICEVRVMAADKVRFIEVKNPKTGVTSKKAYTRDGNKSEEISAHELLDYDRKRRTW